MRVISQNGEFDFPYEQIVVQRNENIVFARLVADSKARNVLGEYKTPEKAEKAMEVLHDSYVRIWDIECGNVSATKQDSCVFQMPQDSEVKI